MEGIRRDPPMGQPRSDYYHGGSTMTLSPSVPTSNDMAQGSVAIGSVPTPLGDFHAVLTLEGLACLVFPDDGPALAHAWVRRWMPEGRLVPAPTMLRHLSDELTSYFEGELRRFSVPVAPRGTPFQVRVWRALEDIPYGETRSYTHVATE